MKKKLPLSLVLLAVVAILSFTGLLATLRIDFQFIDNPLNMILSVCNSLLPFVLVALILLRNKANAKKLSAMALTVFGILKLVGVGFGAYNTFAVKSYSEFVLVVSTIANLVSGALLAVMLLVGADCIKKEQKNNALKALAVAAIVAIAVPALAFSLTGQASLLSYVPTVLLVLGVLFFPATIYAEESTSGVKLEAGTLKTILVVAVIIAIVLLVANAIDNGGSSGGDLEIDRNTTKCFQCKGSGLVNEGFINFKTCPTCHGNGVIFK